MMRKGTFDMQYVMLKDSEVNEDVKAGDVVYYLRKHDYGLASDDTRATGIEHVSVTLDKDGDYPSFTVPRRDIARADEMA